MRVILIESVKSLGSVGELVKVSPGFGRNYLLPNKLAVLADEGNKAALADQKRRLNKKIKEQKAAAQALQGKLNGVTVEFMKRVGGNGRLFGTVTTTEISKALTDQGIEVEKRLIQIQTPIKTLGEFDVTAKLFDDIEAEFKIKVTMDLKQQKENEDKQKAAERKAKSKKDKKEEGKEAQADADTEASAETETAATTAEEKTEE